MFLRRIAIALREQDWPTVMVEFFLVVTGVLLALQLDNWNQQRKDHQLFLNYMTQLQADLRSDVEGAEFRIQGTERLDEAAVLLRTVIKGEAQEPVDDEDLVCAVLVSGYANLNLVRRQTYDEMVSTGNLRLFRDTDLKRSVVAYYSVAENETQWNSLIQSVQIDYRRATRNLLSAEQFRWARRNLRQISTPAPPIDRQRFLDEAVQNTELLGVINAMAEVQERIREDSRRTASRARALLARLETLPAENP